MTRSFKMRCRLQVRDGGRRLGFELLDPVTIPPKHTLTLIGTFAVDQEDDGIELVVRVVIYKSSEEPRELLELQEAEIADLKQQIARARAARAAGAH